MGLPAPFISCSLGSCGRERLQGLFLVGLSPGRRDVQKSTGQARGAGQGEGNQAVRGARKEREACWVEGQDLVEWGLTHVDPSLTQVGVA